MSRHVLMRFAACAAMAGLALAVVTPPAVSAGTDDVWLRFNADAGVANGVANAGTASSTQTLVSDGGGVLEIAASHAGGGNAADFPVYSGSADGPRSVVAVTNPGTVDALTPRGGAFSFGADIRLDSTNVGSPFDNGNNVIQRGLYNDAAQFKIQVDHAHASCRLKGSGGALILTSLGTLSPGSWYRVRCQRTNVSGPDPITLSVWPIRSDGTLGGVSTVSQSIALGILGYGVGTPLSVGGKLNGDLSVVSASDQFNGKIDGAFLSIN